MTFKATRRNLIAGSAAVALAAAGTALPVVAADKPKAAPIHAVVVPAGYVAPNWDGDVKASAFYLTLRFVGMFDRTGQAVSGDYSVLIAGTASPGEIVRKAHDEGVASVVQAFTSLGVPGITPAQVYLRIVGLSVDSIS